MTRVVSPGPESVGVGSGVTVRAQFTLNPNPNLNPREETTNLLYCVHGYVAMCHNCTGFLRNIFFFLGSQTTMDDVIQSLARQLSGRSTTDSSSKNVV